jgi:eukaryotic-like serine/threonine-protein kinase
MAVEGATNVRTVGRYALYEEVAAGGMATVHLARLVGPAGFSRTVAIKKLYPQFARDPEFVSMFLDEARIAGRIRHPNVAATLDVVALAGELFLVMEYIHGESLARLQRNVAKQDAYIPVPIAIAMMHGVAQGLHAAHEARGEDGTPLQIVHRDVSPQNILIGSDGIARVVDFGIAKAVGRLQTTREGQLKGKTAYMAPEQLRGRPVDRRTDIFACGVVLWEALAGGRLFYADSAPETMARVLEMPVEAPSHAARERGDRIPAALDDLVLRAVHRDPSQRYASALELAIALEKVCPPVPTAREVGDYLKRTVGSSLDARAKRVRDIEGAPTPPAELHEEAPGAPPNAAIDVSSVSVETPRRTGQPIPRRALSIAGLALTLLVSVTWLVRPQPRSLIAPIPEPGVSSTPIPLSPSASPSFAPEISSSTAPNGPSAGAPYASAANSIARGAASAASPKPPTRSESGHATRNRPKPPPLSPNPAVSSACKPPYTIDADGFHVAKPECE